MQLEPPLADKGLSLYYVRCTGQDTRPLQPLLQELPTRSKVERYRVQYFVLHCFSGQIVPYRMVDYKNPQALSAHSGPHSIAVADRAKALLENSSTPAAVEADSETL